MKKTFLIAFLSALPLFAISPTYEGCGTSREDALDTLGGNISTSISSEFSQNIEQKNQQVSKMKQSSNLHTSTNLSLVNIQEKKQGDMICLSIKSADQSANVKAIIEVVLSYKVENLPESENNKIKKLKLWIDEIEKLQQLVPVFYNENATAPKKTILEKLDKIHKELQDMHTSLVYQAESKIWQACAADRNEALSNLSSTILTKVDQNFSQDINTTQNETEAETIEKKISSTLKVSSNLSLVNIKEEKKANQICLSVDKKDQLDNTLLFLKTVSTYEIEHLPNDIDKKIAKLKLWIEHIEHTRNLIAAFFKPTVEIGAIHESIESTLAQLGQKEKLFTDLYNDAILQANSLVFKACDDSQEDAYDALNKLLFKSKTKQSDDEGILSKTASFFSTLNPFGKKEEKLLHLFSKEVSYVKQGKEECAVIAKESLLTVATTLNDDVKRFSSDIFSQNPQERYEQIEDYQEHLNVTKALIELFPKQFTKNDFQNITNTKNKLFELRKNTYPQSITFGIDGAAEELKIKLNDTFTEKDKKLYLPEGTYTYEISAKGKCPILGEVTLEFKEHETISKNLSSQNYPTIYFHAPKETIITIENRNFAPNTTHAINKCDGEIHYLADYANQAKKETLSLSPNDNEQITLKFLLPEELKVFKDATTKLFETMTAVGISQSLTPIASDNLQFKLHKDVKNGTLELNEQGSFTYTSKDNFIGIDSFQYVIKTDEKESAPKIVNITVALSNAPVAPVVVEPIEEVKKEDVKKETINEEEVKKIAQAAEERYQKFKIYVDSQEQNIEKLKKLQESYPDLFERLLKEKLSGE